MGHKVHPNGFRLGIIRDWQTHWFAGKNDYLPLLQEDIKIRRLILAKHKEAGVSKVEIERKSNEVRATIFSARPGVVIGRGGQRVEELRKELEKATGKRVRVDIQEIHQPELEAQLVARSIAEQIERQVSVRRAMKQAVSRTMQAGAQGVRVNVGGRLGGSDIARRDKAMAGRVPLHTLRADIDFGRSEAKTQMGQIGVKVWIYRGEVLPQMRAVVPAAEAAVAVAPAPAASAAGVPAPAAPSEDNNVSA